MSRLMTAGWPAPTAEDRDRVTASGQVECTECGHVIEGHTPGCALCDCPTRWAAAEVRDYRRWLGLSAR